MPTDARVVIGVPLYNGSAHLAEALESLLGQTFREQALVLVDDCSIDTTPEMVAKYQSVDDRIHFERNERRLGMVRNWVKAFRRARELHPNMEYFAWASDHDTWHPRWLATLVAELDADPGVVLAYSHAVGLGDEGEIIHRARPFDTVGSDDPITRVRLASLRAPAGYCVYGLFRAASLEKCGVYRLARDPDRLLVTELSAHGKFKQVDPVLYYRRRPSGKPSQERQRASFYPEGVPLHAFAPWPLVHSSILAWSLGVKGLARPETSRLGGLRAAFACLRGGVLMDFYRLLRAYGAETRLGGRLVRWTSHQIKVRQLSKPNRGTPRSREIPRETLRSTGRRVSRRLRALRANR
jgi:glycosyltransferase involved in cell wall biosynthesis